MAFGASQQVSHDISSAFGKGLNGLKVEAIATPKKGAGKGMWGRALLESVMLGVFVVTVAAIPVIVTRVPAPESLIAVMELLQDWCTPSICFGVLIVGGMIATSGVWGSEAGPLTTPEQNHKTFTEAYLSQGPVSATQIDPLRMPDIFFSPEAARAHALSYSATFPARGVAQPSSLAEPVYYPALIPPKPTMQMEENGGRFLGGFETNAGERFMDERFVEDRFVPRADGRFSPRMEGRFSPERFVASKGEGRFGPRVEARFSPERFVNPQVEELYLPQAQDMYPEGDERYLPQAQETYPQVEERYEPQEQGIFEAEEEDLCDSDDESIEFGDCTRDDAPPAETVTTAPDDDDDEEARSESEDEAHDEPEEDARAPFDEAEFERELEREHVESEAAEVEPQVEWRSDVEDEVEHYPYEDDDQSLPDVVSPPPVPEAPPANQVPFSQRSGSSSAAATVASDVELAAANLPSRRKPTTVSAQKAPPPPESVTTTLGSTTNPPHDFTTSARVELKETPEPTARASAPRLPPRHASARQPMPSSSSRSYAEFVRRTSNFSPKTPLEIPRPPTIAKPPVEPVASSTKPKVARSASTNSPTGGTAAAAVTKQQSMPARRPRHVMVVDDEKLDETQGLSEDDDVNQRVEAFLKDFQEQIRLQRQQSLQRHKRSGLN